MNTMHDDLPHPVPDYAHLRYKENYFFIIMGQEEGVYGTMHFNNEPVFNRTKLHFDFLIKGERATYNNIVPISSNFGQEPFVSDGVATMTVLQSHKLFSVVMKSDELDLDLTFTARMPTFDFHACKYAAPEQASFREVATFGLNLPYEHIEQSMVVRGNLRSGDSTISLDCLGYRDHSWGLRADNPTAWHTWSVINFPDRTFAIMSQAMQARAGHVAREGYVADADGVRAMRRVEIEPIGIRKGTVLPSAVLYKATDTFGQTFSLEADVAGCLGQVGLQVEEPANDQVPYTVTENFCTVTDRVRGDTGIGLVELGFNKDWATPFR